jgi:hypothetical protein
MAPLGTPHRPALVWGTVATLVVLASRDVAFAEPIRYEYGGVITSADPSTGATSGTRFEGSFTYDPAAQAPATGFTYEGFVGYAMAPDRSGLTLNVGGRQVFDANGLGLDVNYGPRFGPTPSAQDPAMTRVSIVGETDQLGVTLRLANLSRSVFSPFPAPTSLSLDDFPDRQLLVIDRASHRGETLFGGTIDTLTPVPVPEPTTLATFVVVLGGMGFRRLTLRR